MKRGGAFKKKSEDKCAVEILVCSAPRKVTRQR